jgi:uncharacterized membrane protein
VLFLRRFGRDERGAVAVIVVASAAALLGFSALAIDMGSIFLQTRKLQGMADMAALAAARDIDHAQLAANATALDNGWSGPITTETVTGRYLGNPSIAPANRFVAGGADPDAAKVTLKAKADLFFGQAILGKATTDISRTAIATRADLAAFSIGTKLATLNGGIANSLLTALTGSSVSLSVMDYNALATADVDLLAYSKALQTNLGLQAVSFDEVLDGSISTGKALTVLADLLQSQGSASAATATRKLATAAGTSTPAKLNKLFDLGPYGNQDHVAGGSGVGIKLNAMDLANGVLSVSQGGRQLQLDLGASVPGLADVNAYVGIGERPANSAWITVTRDKTVIVRTAQIRIYLEVKVLSSGGAVGGAGISLVKLPLLVEAASAQAKLNTLNCASNRPSRAVTLSVMPSIGQVAVAEIDTSKIADFTHELALQPATLVNLGLIKATVQAQTKLGGASWKTATFTQAEIDAATTKTVSTDDLVQASLASLLGNLSIGVTLGPLSLLNLSALADGLEALIAPLASPLDGVLNSLTNLLGVRLGVADVRVNGLRCGEAALIA